MNTLQNISFTNGRYAVRFAQNEADVEAAQRLRYNVFNVEMGEGLQSSEQSGLDIDNYDQQCHHLLVISNKTEEIIGTYRMQTYDIAVRNNGYYTAEEFDITAIDSKILDDSIEVGRACIAQEHRNGRVLFLLWRGLAKYLVEYQKRYLLGCCSLTSQSAAEAWSVMHYLQENKHTHPSAKVSTTVAYECPQVEVEDHDIKINSLPQLFRLYMDLGAKVCSPPAIDKEFKTIDYLILLDVDELDERSRILFFN